VFCRARRKAQAAEAGEFRQAYAAGAERRIDSAKGYLFILVIINKPFWKLSAYLLRWNHHG
jgi:hypothetical protein